MRPVECGKCHKFWNPKFNNRCPRCKSQEVVRGPVSPVTEEDVARLKEHFG